MTDIKLINWAQDILVEMAEAGKPNKWVWASEDGKWVYLQTVVPLWEKEDHVKYLREDEYRLLLSYSSAGSQLAV